MVNVKKRRLKNSVKFSFLAILALIVLGSTNLSGFDFEEISGLFTADEYPNQDGNIVTYFINRTGDAKLVDDHYEIFQYYQIGKNSVCVNDCVNVCRSQWLDYYKAYVQEWGVCRCKCEIPEGSI